MGTITEEERLEHIKQQSESGLTIKAYCAAHGFTFHSFQYWRKKYKRNNSLSDGGHNGAFIEVAAPRSSAGGGITSIYLPNGVRIDLGQELDNRLLKLLCHV